MDSLTFLQCCLPTIQQGEYYCIIGVRGKVWKHRYCKSLEEAADVSAAFSANGDNVYFSVGLLSDTSRRKVNATYVIVFSIDIDIKQDDDHYHYLADAYKAVDEFAAKYNLIKPMLVQTGGGVHVYWPLTKALSSAEYTVLARGLKQALLKEGVKFDKGTVGNPVQVLRVVDTLNQKYDPPFLVHVARDCLRASEPHEFEQFRKLGEDDIAAQSVWSQNFFKGTPGTVEGLLRNCPAAAFLAGPEGMTLHYDVWRALGSNAALLEDGAQWFHEVSSQHPEYSAAYTQRKLDDAYDFITKDKGGPVKCATIALDCKQCKTCPFLAMNSAPASVAKISEEEAAPAEEDKSEEAADGNFMFNGRDYTIGSFKVEGSARIEGRPEIQYRLKVNGQRVFVDLNTLRDRNKINQVLTPYETVAVADLKQWEGAMLNEVSKPEIRKVTLPMVATSMGWNADFTMFKYGVYQITKDGIIYAPPVNEVEPIVKDIRPNGAATSDGWFQHPDWIEKGFVKQREILQHFFQPGLEHQAAMIVASLAGVLYPIYEQDQGGVILSMYGAASGTGKTTTLQAALSLWGLPSALLLQNNSSSLQHQEKMCIIRHLPVGIDEVWKFDPVKTIMDMQTFTTGKPKERLDQSGAMVLRTGNWTIHLFQTSNRSTLAVLEGRPDAVAMGERVIEVHFPPLPSKPNTGIMKGLRECSGFIGPWLLTKILLQPGMIDLIRKEIATEIEAIYDSGDFEPQHRIKVTHLAAWKVACRILFEYGVFNFDAEELYGYYRQAVIESSKSVRVKDIVATTNEYIQFNKARIFNADAAAEIPDTVPLIGRFDAEKGIIYLGYTWWRDYVVKLGFNEQEALMDLYKRKKIQSVYPALTKMKDSRTGGFSPDIEAIAFIPDENELIPIIKPTHNRAD